MQPQTTKLPGLSTRGISVDTKTPAQTLPLSPEDRLDSWKSIAQYLHRDIRTVQRWETEGLPVYRHHHSKHGSIYAYRSEVDAWWLSRRPSASKQKSTERKAAFRGAPWLHSRYVRLCSYVIIILLIGLSALAIRRFLLDRRPFSPADSARIARNTIAILPFHSSSPDPKDGVLAQTLTQNVLKNLRHSASLHIIDTSSIPGVATNDQRGSSTSRKALAEEALQGSISREGPRIRITAQLIDPATGNTMWSTEFESDAASDPVSQDRISRAIAAGVENALALKED